MTDRSIPRLVKKLSRRPTLRDREDRTESGETLLEILLALIILSLASVALITAFGTSVNASAEHRRLANFNTVLASSISTTTTTMQQQSAGVFNSCEPLSSYPSSAQITAALGLTGYTAAIAASGTQPAVEYSDGGVYSTNCNADDVGNPQLINVVVTNTQTGFTQSNTVVVDNPNVIGPSGAVGATADQLVFITQPEGATVGNNFATQPRLEVEDSAGNIVTSDLSPITLTVGTGPAGATLSSTCSGQETAGVVTYTGCSLNVIGTNYELFASEPSPTQPGLDLTSASAPFSVYPSQLNTPTATIVPSITTAGAVNVSYTGALNAPNGQAYSVKVCQDSAMSVNCVIRTNFVSGTDITLLTAGTNYWAQVSAVASQNFLGSTSPPVGPALATVQLPAPGPPTLTFGPSSGSVTVVSFTGSAGAPSGQIYTALACTTMSMTGGSCVTNTNIVAGSAITGLSPGLSYFVELSANASKGYLASGRSTISTSQAATTALKTPVVTSSPSVTTAGAITASFVPAAPPTPSYTALACTNATMNANCVTITGYTAGAQITGLTPGTNYFVTITAVSTTNGVASATSAVSGPTMATVQLTAPTNVVVGFGSTAGSVSITAGASNGPAGQVYSDNACVSATMTGNTCVANGNYTLGNDITGLKFAVGQPGSVYNVQITALASPGYLGSTPSTIASGTEMSEIGAPNNVTATSPSRGVITVTFTAASGPAPSAYNVEVCTNVNNPATCTIHLNATPGTPVTFTNLTSRQTYIVEVVAIAPVGYVNNTTANGGTRVT
jgi:hypothetical protein